MASVTLRPRKAYTRNPENTSKIECYCQVDLGYKEPTAKDEYQEGHHGLGSSRQNFAASKSLSG
jgi:hypothetical protein